MGRYTELARRLREDVPQERGATSTDNILNVNIHSIYSNIDSSIDKPTSARPKDTLKGSSSVDSIQSRASGSKNVSAEVREHATNVRTTNLTNLMADGRCVHELSPRRCAVCSGYVRWLIAGGDARLAEARGDPEGARRRFEGWRVIDGGKA